MPQLDERFLALPLGELSDAALSKAKELGCSHAEIRVERIRQAYRSFRDHALETTADGQILGLSVRVVHDGVWGFASDITLSTDSAAHLAERAVATAKVSRPLTPASVELADEGVYADADWVSAYEVNPFDVDEATKTGRVLGLNEALLVQANRVVSGIKREKFNEIRAVVGDYLSKEFPGTFERTTERSSTGSASTSISRNASKLKSNYGR